MSVKQLSDDERARRRAAEGEQAVKAVEALRSTSGWQAWLGARRHFHKYSFANQLLIALQCPGATHVAGFRAWLKLGYAVRKGERAIRIWVPVPPSKAKLEAWKESGGHPDDRPRTFFKLGPVFDRSQTSPLPPPSSPAPLEPPIASVEGDELGWAMNPLTAFASALGSEVEFEAMPTGHGGYYEIATRRIALNEKHSVNGQVKTLIHELTHALLRAEPEDDDPALSYAEEELVVESVAYTVCGSVGLDVTGYAIPYLACWSEVATIETIQASAVLIDCHARRLEDVLAAGRAEPGDQ